MFSPAFLSTLLLIDPNCAQRTPDSDTPSLKQGYQGDPNTQTLDRELPMCGSPGGGVHREPRHQEVGEGESHQA